MELHEASGVAASRKREPLLWAHNDSGKPVVLALDANGAVTGRVQVAGARVEDWEDIAVGPCSSGSCLYIADIGDNGLRRPHIAVYRVAEPAPNAAATENAEVFRATYPDGPHDAEAFFVTGDGRMFIVTKGVSGPIAIYRFPPQTRADATVRLERIGEALSARAGEDDRITGAAVSADDRWLALRTHDSIRFFQLADATNGRWREAGRMDVRALREPQGEGIAFGPEGSVYLVGEGGKGSAAGTLARLECTLPR
jgi:hypothetical protein